MTDPSFKLESYAMLFVLICNDKPGHLQVRLDNRPDHVVYLNGLKANGSLKLAGPFLDADGKSNGSLLIVEAEDAAAAAELSANDPFAKAGLFESVEIRPWNWTVNNPAAV